MYFNYKLDRQVYAHRFKRVKVVIKFLIFVGNSALNTL